MTREEFEKKVTELTGGRFAIREKLPPEEQPTPRSRRMRTFTKEISVEWLTGGMSGGSCWGGEPRPLENWEKEKEPEFEDLDLLLEHFAPNITFMKYKRLNQNIVEEGFRYEPDYYGNSREYDIKKVSVNHLYDWLVENNYIETPELDSGSEMTPNM
jgi:hypothetical protein